MCRRCFPVVCVLSLLMGCGSPAMVVSSGDAIKASPATDPVDAATRDLVEKLNAAVRASDVSVIRGLMYSPTHNYDASDMDRYFEAVAAGQFAQHRFDTLHAEVEPPYAAVLISQLPTDTNVVDVIPVAVFHHYGRWQVLPYDLPKDHPDLGPAAPAAYKRLLEQVLRWFASHQSKTPAAP